MISRRVLVAPDKFKGTLTATQAAKTLADVIRNADSQASVIELPIADGGDGSVDAVVAAGGARHCARVIGPLARHVSAHWASLGDLAVIELASASGLQLLDPSPETAMAAHTTGTGELIRIALDHGYRSIAVCLGGSASTDGGAGLLSALGARYFDDSGRLVEPSGGTLYRIAAVDLSMMDRRLSSCQIVACCDIESPLLGPKGASYAFGSQKGADRQTIEMMEYGLSQFASALQIATGSDARKVGWGGAAGGTAAGLYAGVRATYRSGFDFIADVLGMDTLLCDCDLVVVGEGRLDEQSLTGKAPVALARRAAALGIPVIAVAGHVALTQCSLTANGITIATSATECAAPNDPLLNPHRWLREATAEAFEAYQMLATQFSSSTRRDTR